MPRTLLLADDSVTIQKVVGLSFANEDIRLVTVDNGDDAISRAREVRPDIVLADVVMPGKNGYEVCEAIKSDPALSHVPVLLLTGTFEAFDEERARRARADGHITKPFEAQALVEQVNRLLAAAQPAVSPNEVTRMAAAPAEADFFDEELAEPALETAGSDDASSFELGEEGEDLGFSLPEEHGGPTADATIAMLDDDGDEDWVTGPETDPLLGEADLGGFASDEPLPGSQPGREGERILEPDLPTPAPVAAPVPVAAAAPTGHAALPTREAKAPADEEEPFEFGFDDEPAVPRRSGDDPLAHLDAEDLAREAVIDPEGGRSYDVSWSDLGDPLAPARPAAAAPAPPAVAPVAPPPSASSFTAPPTPAPFVAPAPPAPAPRPAAPPAPMPPVTAPPPAPPAAPAAPVAAPATRPAARASAAPAVTPDLSPVLRERLHDTLEKIAWEAFSDLSDTIVRQVVERVEAVAWEVIPQMAEALIREEIRRLKAEPE